MTNIFENESDTSSQRRWYQKPLVWVRIFYATLIVAIIIIGLALHSEIWEFLKLYLDWMRTHLIIGSLAYVALHTVWVAIALPGTYLTLGAGFVYAHLFSFWEGVAIATILSLSGTTIGSIIAFLNGRYVLRNFISRHFENNNKWIVIEHMAESHGIKFVTLLRFSFVPTSLVNYGTSVTKIQFLHFLIGCISFIPDIFIHSFVGAEMAQLKDLFKGKITKSEMPLFIASMVVMAICVLLVAFLVYYAKRQVDKMAQEQEKEDEMMMIDKETHDAVTPLAEQHQTEPNVPMSRRGSLGITDVTPFGVKQNAHDVTISERAPLLL